jgi:hypothetical protein
MWKLGPESDQFCGSGMFIPDTGSYFYNLFVVMPFYVYFYSHKYHKIENYFSFEMLKKKTWTKFQRFLELFTQKIITKLSKIWVWYTGSEIRDPRSGIRDPGYEIRKKPIPDPGSRGQKGTGYRIRIYNTGSDTINFGSRTTLSAKTTVITSFVKPLLTNTVSAMPVVTSSR